MRCFFKTCTAIFI